VQAVLALGPTLMKLRSASVVGLRYEAHAKPWTQLAAGQSALRNISRGSYTVGSFVFETDGAAGRGCSGGARRAVLLANYDWTNTQTPTVDFGSDCHALEVRCLCFPVTSDRAR